MSTPQISRFKGLNNVSDPLRLGLGWLSQADNCDITDTGALQARAGYSLVQAGSFSGAYTTIDLSRMYAVKNGTLVAMTSATTALTLASGLSSKPMYFTEVNGQVFYNNGVDSGIINSDNSVLTWAWPDPSSPSLTVTGNSLPGQYRVCCVYVTPDGRRTGTGEVAIASSTRAVHSYPEQPLTPTLLQISNIPQIAGYSTEVFIAPADSEVFQSAGITSKVAMNWYARPNELGAELRTMFLNPLPDGCTAVALWKGRVYAAQWMADVDQSVIWFSQPLGYHLFNPNQDFFIVPGRALMLAAHYDALIVGTDKRVFAYSDKLVELAEYGVVPGVHVDRDDDGKLYFWTIRGVCAALPFENLTERQVSVAPGLRATGLIVRKGGQKRYVVALQKGGSAFNSNGS